MSKKIYIEEDKLMGIKRFMTGENAGHKPFIAEDEPPYEKDEFVIGGEGGNNDFFHVNENKVSYVDLSEVGEVAIEDWTYDEEEYQEWLVDNELQDTPENKMNYIEDFNVEFEVNFLDNQTYHTMCCEWVYYDDLVEKFGDNMAKKIESAMIENGSFKFDTSDIYADENYDINNPQELDDIAMKLLPHGEYFKGCRGFILSNGVIVYTEGEHNDVLRIPGIDSKWQFIELGNIRLLPNSIDIGSEPTYEQEEVLEYMLRLYDGEEIYLDIFSENGEIGAHYPSADCNYIMGEIKRYYSEGIRPQGGGFYESKESGKKILVSEKQLLTLKENTFENWFGNSILKDENGEPIKMYHGTDAEFDSFSKKFIGKTGAHEGYGFNFTPYESRARSYNSKNVIEAYLKVENPMTTGSYNITSSKLAKIISEIDKGVPYTDTIVAAYEPTRYNENWDERYYRRALPVVVRQLIQYNRENEYGDAGIYADICLCGNGDKLKVIDTFEKLGYDSVIFYDNYGKLNTVVVFEPNQIKRTNNKTFSIDSDLMGENNKSKNIIKESQESKSISAAKKLVMQRFNYNEQEADELIRIKLRNDIPSLRTPQGGKFILGVTRMFCDGELTSANDIGKLNSTLKLVASNAHINEYDRNLNNLSYQELIQRFSKAMSDNLEAEKNEIDQMTFNSPSDYEIVRIDSFEQAEEYGDYVSWCVTHDEEMFDSYTSDGINQFYFCLKNGFEGVEEVPSEGCPLDEYGLSMIAVSVNENGMLNTCTCRWNHDNGGDDGIMNTKEISQVIGMNFFEAFKPNNKWKDLLTNVMQRLADGEDPRDVFGYVGDFNEGFALVELNGKCNFINQEGRLLSDQWFDNVGNFNEGFAWLELNGKCNFINQEGKFLSNQWFDNVCNFSEGFAKVELNYKYNFINQEGKFLSDQWFNIADSFNEGFAWVRLNVKYNFINQEGKFLSDQWFDAASVFKNGFAIVRLNGKCNFINQEGKFLSNQWFDSAEHFNDGFARVKLNGKWQFIDTNGKMYVREGKNILVSESQLITLKENMETEVEASEVKLNSFKKKNTLAPKMWDGFELDSRARLKLLDIADDFWDFANITWVKRKGIHLTGSICNFNWSKFSDIDLHIVVDFSEVDERKDFVQEYFDGKKNEWNGKHSKLKIYGYPVELYVEDVDAETASEGLYDLEKNEWIKKPNPNGIKSIGLDKYEIKDKSAELMTAIDDLNDEFNETDDDAKLRKIGEKAHDLYDKIKKMRKSGLERGGENDPDNIAYKVLRRSGYMDTLRTLSSELYDKVNSIDLDETVISLYAKKYVPINEEVVADGNADHNPFKKRWKYERDTLKNYLVNYGELMTSKENGKQYKVLYDQFISGRLGINYCLCIQWNSMTNKPGNIIYVRAFDKFTRKIFKPEFDTRGFDNQAGTADDLVRY